MTRLLLAVPALLAVVALAGAVGPPEAARADETPAAQDTVTVTGVGSVQVVPNEAQLSFGVETRGATAKAALEANGAAMRKLVVALRDAGARDLATQYVSVWPATKETGAIEGYSASNSVAATTNVDHVGELIDAAVDAGANQISGPTMSRNDSDRVYRQALADAISDARERADVLAKAAGRAVGEITAMVEGSSTPIPYYEKATLAADSATPIVPGTQETSATVSVTFELR